MSPEAVWGLGPDLVWAVPALPLAGFVLLALAGGRMPRRAVAWIGVGSVGGAAALAFAVAARFFTDPPTGVGEGVRSTLWTWMEVGDLSAGISLYLDPLAVVMMLVVTGVGFLIHFYSAEFMAGDEGFSRFFASMNLFVGAMLMLVLADNLVLLYLGWEGVGLCSYLLIGFWYRDPDNGRAARKAFIVTRVGDTAMALGLFLLFTRLGTLDVQELLARAAERWEPGSGVAVAAAALLLGGAVGKSAQLPLQTWLPDAMAGPTPVSALIHAATMVTAGVYLVARTHTLFELAPPVMAAVAAVGAATLLLAACAALAQRDIKRILAYSTISQIGYMFLALGIGAWSAAVFHLVTHAFFKALLFLGAGAVILTCHHEHDIFRLGGLKDRLPVTFWTFLVAGAALAGVPLVTAGFYSKDLILAEAFTGGHAGLWAAGLAGALLTALYTFRMIFVAFFGEVGTEPEYGETGRPGLRIAAPLVVLAVLSVAGGFVETPATLGGVHALSGFLEPSFEGPEPGGGRAEGGGHPPPATELLLQGLAALVSLGGIALAWARFRPGSKGRSAPGRLPLVPAGLHGLWGRGWGFDRLYGTLLVAPYVRLAVLNRADAFDWIYRGLAGAVRAGHHGLAVTQTGRLRWYAAGIALGAVIVLGLVLALLLGWIAVDLGAPGGVR